MGNSAQEELLAIGTKPSNFIKGLHLQINELFLHLATASTGTLWRLRICRGVSAAGDTRRSIIFKECYNLVLIDENVFIQPLGIVWPAAELAVSSCSGWTVEEGWGTCQSLGCLLAVRRGHDEQRPAKEGKERG